VEITQDIVEESEDERFDDMADSAPPVDLPPCELARLDEINDVIITCLTSQVRKEKLASAIESDGYIRKLLNLFHMCEDVENMDGLRTLYEIFKNIFLLNKNALFEVMFSGKCDLFHYYPARLVVTKLLRFWKRLGNLHSEEQICFL